LIRTFVHIIVLFVLAVTPVPADAVTDPVRSKAFSDLALASWRSRDYRLAYAHALDALRHDTNNIEAGLVAARFAILEMLGPQEWGEVLERAEGDLEAYVEDRADEAIERLNRILAIDPDLVPARILIGLVYYENEMFHRLVAQFEDYRRRQPEQAEPYFMLSLGLHAQGDEEHARIAFTHGLNRLVTGGRYMRAGFVLGPRDTPQNTENLRLLWAPEDPLHYTPTNERLMEHYQRVAYANLRFSEDDEMLKGWESDRGRIYIRYGAPPERFIATSSVGPDQLWSYVAFSVSFMRLRMSPWTYRNGIIGSKEYRTMDGLTSAFPPTSNVADQWPRQPLACRVAQFRGEDGKTRIDLDVTFRDNFVHSSPGPRGARRVEIDYAVSALDMEWQEQSRSVTRLDHLAWIRQDEDGGFFVRSEALLLPPGPSQVVIESLDLATSGLGVFYDTLDVRSFDAPTFALSDILISRRSAAKPGEPRTRSAMVFLPAPDGIGVRGKHIEAYAEVYHLGVFAKLDSSSYTVQFAVRGAEHSEGWVVVSSEEMSGNRRSEPLQLKLDLKQTAPGPKVLRLRVTDHSRRETIEKQTDFRVVW